MRRAGASDTVLLVKKAQAGTRPPDPLNDAAPPQAERRAAIRTLVHCPVRVRWAGERGRTSGVEAIVVQVSATGLYMYAMTRVCAGARLFTIVPLPSGARVALRGYVTRVELRGHEHFGIAVRFTRTRLLPAESPGATPRSSDVRRKVRTDIDCPVAVAFVRALAGRVGS
jgi:hypothetical protein